MKRKKAIKRRGAGRSQGWGSVKKHRGAGNRGGRGNAGAKKQGKMLDRRYFARQNKKLRWAK